MFQVLTQRAFTHCIGLYWKHYDCKEYCTSLHRLSLARFKCLLLVRRSRQQTIDTTPTSLVHLVSRLERSFCPEPHACSSPPRLAHLAFCPPAARKLIALKRRPSCPSSPLCDLLCVASWSRAAGLRHQHHLHATKRPAAQRETPQRETRCTETGHKETRRKEDLPQRRPAAQDTRGKETCHAETRRNN